MFSIKKISLISGNYRQVSRNINPKVIAVAYDRANITQTTAWCAVVNLKY